MLSTFLLAKRKKIQGTPSMLGRELFMKRVLFLLLLSLTIGGFSAFAQSPKATAFEIKGSEAESAAYYGGELYITVDGKQKKIAEQANDVWITNGGKEVVYSARDGAGGYENEGQSLRIYDVATGETRKIMSEYSYVVGLSEVKLTTGASALLVRLEDGGLGGSYFALVDPKRGQVFFKSWTEVKSVKGDTLTLVFYKENDWENINQSRGTAFYDNKSAIPAPSKVKPYKTQVYDLKKLIKKGVIYNRPTMEMYGDDFDPKKTKFANIYLWRANEEMQNKNFVLSPVSRNVNKAAPLKPALEALFKGASQDEESQGFSSSTFGMKFEGVVLKNGIALVKFSQPKDQTNHGSQAPSVFIEAIEKTAGQFPTVKKVQVCAIGETLIDAQLEKQFPRCAR